MKTGLCTFNKRLALVKKVKKKMVEAFENIMESTHDEPSTTYHDSFSCSFVHSFSVEKELFKDDPTFYWSRVMSRRANGLRLSTRLGYARRKNVC